jgi:hypothetical protein
MRSSSVSRAVYQPWIAQAASARAAASPGARVRRTSASSRSAARRFMAARSSPISPRSRASAAADAACSGLIEPLSFAEHATSERLGELLEAQQVHLFAGVGSELFHDIRPERPKARRISASHDEVDVRARPESAPRERADEPRRVHHAPSAQSGSDLAHTGAQAFCAPALASVGDLAPSDERCGEITGKDGHGTKRRPTNTTGRARPMARSATTPRSPLAPGGQPNRRPDERRI